MSVAHSNENLAAAIVPSVPIGRNCSICLLRVEDGQVNSVTPCNHVFHSDCIKPWIQENNECPNCKALVAIKDLKPYFGSPKKTVPKPTVTNTRGVGRPRGRGGATPKTYVTRNRPEGFIPSNLNLSNTPNITRDPSNSPNTSNNNPAFLNNTNPNLITLAPTQISNPSIEIRRNPEYNINEISEMIERTVERLLAIRLHENQPRNSNLNSNSPRQNDSFHNQTNNSNFDNHSNRNLSNVMNNPTGIYSDRIANIIHNWNVKFDGSSDGLTADQFLYRIRCLTHECLNHDFEALSRHLHILLTGKAREWFWRYRKPLDQINFNHFCNALKAQYCDYKTRSDIKEELRSRYQKENESFESYYEAVNKILDRLEDPIPEEELVEILKRRLRTDIRHELLYVEIHSVSDLRKRCQMRENLLAEEVQRNRFEKSTNNPNKFNKYKKNISALESNEENVSQNSDSEIEISIDAINTDDKLCFNCHQPGHFWDSCTSPKTVFCFGCGKPNTYRPQCEFCNQKKSENSKKGAFKNNRMPPQ